MLQNIVKKVDAEGKAAEDLFDKFMCECRQKTTGLEKSIEAAQTKGADVSSGLAAGEGQLKQLQADIVQAKKDRAAAKEAIAAATGIREKELAAFKDSSGVSSANIQAMSSAIQAIQAGGSSFVQTDAVKQIRDIVQMGNMEAQDREEVMAFLQNGESEEGTGEVVGMLKTLQEDMSKDLADATAVEADAVATYEQLVRAKNKEFETLQAAIEEKMARLGDLSVSNAESANDGGDTADALAEDKKVLADTKASCDTRQKEWDAEKKKRGEELLALADTIKMLNSDEALELFKKAIPSASSFLQVAETSEAVRARALDVLHAAKKNKKMLKVDFVALALHGQRKGFGAVVAMIDKFIAALNADQKEDDDKVVYCNKEFDKSDDEKKALERKVGDAQTAIDDAKESVATLIDEIKNLKASIVMLDGEVAIATMQRQKENAEFKDVKAQNGAAVELITMAKTRLNKFYKAAFVQMDDDQVREEEQTKTGNVIAMMDTIVRDLEQETAVAATEETNAQADYEQAMADSKEKRTVDAKTLEDKSSAKADADAAVQTNVDAKTAAGKELQGVKDFIMMLHADCDWIIKYYDTRKQARGDELDALSKAKDVLNGADYSFLQLSARSHLRGIHRA